MGAQAARGGRIYIPLRRNRRRRMLLVLGLGIMTAIRTYCNRASETTSLLTIGNMFCRQITDYKCLERGRKRPLRLFYCLEH